MENYIIVSGVLNSTPFLQTYELFSYYFKQWGFQIIESLDTNIFGVVLVETNPQQTLRQLLSKNFLTTFYVGVEKPSAPPFYNLLVGDFSVFIKKYDLNGQDNCILGRATDEIYIKKGTAFVFNNETFLIEEEKAYAKRFGAKIIPYTTQDIMQQISEQCSTIKPLNKYAKTILRSFGLYPPGSEEYITLNYSTINGYIKRFVSEYLL